MIRVATAVAFASALTLGSACAAGQESSAMPPPPPPSLWEPYTHFALVRDPDMSEAVGEPWYELVGVAIEQGTVRRMRAPRFCREGVLWSSEGDGAVFIEDGTLREDAAGPVAALRVVDCHRCAAPTAGWPIETLPVAYPSSDTIRIGHVVYDRRTDPESRVCPPDAGTVTPRAGQSEAS